MSFLQFIGIGALICINTTIAMVSIGPPYGFLIWLNHIVIVCWLGYIHHKGA